jgi:hypothetical protein
MSASFPALESATLTRLPRGVAQQVVEHLLDPKGIAARLDRFVGD